jgi:hypothetical protein
MTDEQKIVDLFYKNVKGKRPNLSGFNSRHDGSGGHWLESQMGIAANASNTPDLYGYEMKNNTTSKTTFGDWSADYYIYNNYNLFGFGGRDTFLAIFGRPNLEKNGRLSWSGAPAPKINTINYYGQVLVVDAQDNIHAKYFYTKDKRVNKATLIPLNLQQEDLTIARWDQNSIKRKLEKKFNQKGWFKCLTDANGVYTSIVFGGPINYQNWIKLVKTGEVFFDSGMYEGNPRPYSQWRAQNSLWKSLILKKY